MARKQTPTFVHELPLIVSPGQEKQLLIRMDQARQLYNACLGESLRRLDLMRQSILWQEAKSIDFKDKKIKKDAFALAKETYSFLEYSIHAFAGGIRKSCSIKDHVDSSTCQKIATRAFNAVNLYMFGVLGRPRFKGFNQLISVEGKSNATGIRWRDDHVVWSKLKLIPIFDLIDKNGIQAHVLQSKIKFVRIVRRRIRSKNRFYVQLVLEGIPKPKKNCAESGIVGLDLGPSSIAAVGEESAFLKGFCEEIEPLGKIKKQIQKKLDRSRRATNPHCFNENGTWKKGEKFTPSNNYIAHKEKLAELERRIAGYRKTLHGKLANEVYAMGNEIHLEKISYRAWQKMFGRSVGNKAPGMFVDMLHRKAESAGGKVIETPLKLALSQICHCGNKKKKGLNVRWHNCPCGAIAQRDLYSAFLARFANETTFDTVQAQKSWPSAEALLTKAVSKCNQTTTGKLRLSSFGLGKIPRWSCSLGKADLRVYNEAEDAVLVAKATGRASESYIT